MNFQAITEYIPLYWDAMLLTLKIGWTGILLSIIIGFVTALIRQHKIPVLSQFTHGYIELFRNTPLMVQLFFMYFALPRLGLPMNTESCGVLGIALFGGAYMSETVRSGMEAVDKGQMEGALSLGFSPLKAELFVIIPQAVATSVPAFTANIIFLLKETSVFSAISLMDLMFTAKDLIGLYYKTTECLLLLVIFYLIILLPVSFAGSVVEKKLRFV